MEHKLDELNRLQDAETNFRSVVSSFRAHLAYGRDEFLVDIQTYKTRYHDYLSQLITDSSIESQGSGKYTDLHTLGDEYFNLLETGLSLKQANQMAQINELSITKITPLVETIDKQFETLVHSERENLTKLTDKNKRLNTLLLWAPLIMLAAAVLFVYRLRNHLRRTVISPIQEMESVVREIGGGQFNYLEESGRKDEVGRLVTGINIMISQLQNRQEELDHHLSKLSEQHDELEALNEEIMTQQMERQRTLDLLTEREAKLETITSYQEHLTGFAEIDTFLNNSLTSLVKALRLDAVQLMMGISNDTYECLYTLGYPKPRNQIMSDQLFGPARRVIHEKKPIVRTRPLSGTERGVHGGYEYACDQYYPLYDDTQEIEGFLLLTTYGVKEPSQGSLDTAEGLVNQFFLAFVAQVANEKRRKQAEELEILNKQLGREKMLLGEQRDRFRRIVDSLHEGIIICDYSGEISFVNKPITKLLSEEVKVGSNIEWLYENPDINFSVRTVLRNQITLALGGSMSDFREFREFFSIGSDKHFEIYLNNLNELNEKDQFLFVFRDRTEEEAADRLKNEFVSIVSHELRTPLASIMGFVEILLKREVQPAKRIKYLETIHNESIRLSSLITTFLDLQRMESGKQNYIPIPLDLRNVADKVAAQWKNTQTHRIVTDFPDEPCYIKGDTDRIIQVLHNLISNAVKYSPGADLVNLRIRPENGDWVIDIQDYGLGIPDESKDQLFNKFYRVDNSDRRQIGGTGLGLAIVKEMVEGMGGAVSFQSKLGQGSTFSVSFNTFQLVPLSGKIVVVEDDDTLGKLIAAPFEERNYEVYLMDTAEEALLHLNYTVGLPPLLCIVDVQLKGEKSGWDFVSGLLNHEFFRSTPVIVSSVLERPDISYSEYQYGAYLQKPFTVERLLELGEQLIKQSNGSPRLILPVHNEEEVKASLEQNGIEVAELNTSEDFIKVDLGPVTKGNTEREENDF
ncbi:ATP-binding protein [Paenibacillus tianjinensis]|uniref:histidine kinase n=1 Tax=Paenibacillus tianjinensis TaxID=2810347 RepID=A0ABX7L4S9_9BACL|nr:ATP-binding protein [Paenibacillus tianjinensis]QSF42486.1 HAMP domain-containing protein [Paenibacillus tianjinensis]